MVGTLVRHQREKEFVIVFCWESILIFFDKSEVSREMDLISGESSKVLRKQGFRSLKLMSVDMEQELGNEPEPFGADYGRLDNGLVYYVRRNSKPRMRAALALAVKVG